MLQVTVPKNGNGNELKCFLNELKKQKEASDLVEMIFYGI